LRHWRIICSSANPEPSMKIQFQRLSPSALPPQQMTVHSAGFDLSADIPEALVLAPGMIMTVPTGIAVAIPEGFEAQIRPRSGLAARHGISIVNSPGTIDADYRGEIKIILVNLGAEPFRIEPLMRIAQLIISPVVVPEWEETAELPSTGRNDNGFGHTGY